MCHQDIPRLEVPLHTLIELTPKPDGTMHEERFYVDVDEFKESLSRGMNSRTDMDHVTSFGDLRCVALSAPHVVLVLSQPPLFQRMPLCVWCCFDHVVVDYVITRHIEYGQ